MDNQVKQAIDSNLSRMYIKGRDVSVIMGNVREGKRVKKKLPAAFVLIAILILAAVSVLAATRFFEYAI
jgi:hypothetical protein